MGKTRIQVTEETRDKLKTIGQKGESYDDVINWLIGEVPLETVAEFRNKIEEVEE